MALAELDGPLLAARWCRAVIASDVPLIAACEREADQRGTAMTALVAATKKTPPPPKQSALEETLQRTKDRLAGKKRPSGGTKPENQGKGRFRKKTGPGGGQFTSADDPGAIAEGDIQAGRAEQQGLADERRNTAARRKAEDEAERRQRFEEDAADRAADEEEAAAKTARKNETAAQKAARKAEAVAADRTLSDDITRRTGQIALKTKLRAEALQLGKEDEATRLANEIEVDRAAVNDLDQQRKTAKANQADEPAAAAEADTGTKRARDAAKRARREAERRAKADARAAEDAAMDAKAAELRARIEDARQRKKEAAAAKKKGR